jgi:ribonuclease HI
MELMAVIAGLEALNKEGLDIIITSDSKYIVDAVEQKWVFGWLKKGFKGKKNEDLWRRFLELYKKHKIKFKWIKGHNDHPLNERCDELAVSAALGNNLIVDVGYVKQI